MTTIFLSAAETLSAMNGPKHTARLNRYQG